MSSNLGTQAAAPALAAAPQAGSQGRLYETLVTLVRREFWEHRALWLAPALTAAVLVVLSIVAVQGHGHHIRIDGNEVGDVLTRQQSLAISTLVQAVIWVVLSLVAVWVVTFYFVDCLYAERRDRSIYFWKSLPVSDGITVGSKLLVGILLVPLGVLLLAAVTHIVVTLVFAAHAALGQVPRELIAWSTLTWLRVEWLLLLGVVLGALWYAPIAGYLMLVSVLARRNPLMWAMVPLLLSLLEFVVFRTTYVSQFITYRTGGIWDVLANHGNLPFIHQHSGNGMNLQPLDTLLGQLNFRAAFSFPDLWLGVVVAAALIYAATRVRRFRDDA
jgi:ABC-2 type transport system permease protein